MSMKDKSPVFMIGVIMFVAGAALFGIKFYSEWNGVTTMGTVSKLTEWSETDTTGTVHTYYEPTIAFITEEGDSSRGTVHSSNEAPYLYEVGQKIEIVYQRRDPTRIFKAQSFLWYIPFLGAAVLGVFIMRLSFRLKSEGWDGR